MMDTQSTDAGDPQMWDMKVRKNVEEWQEQEYRRLAEELQLGSDPKKAYARLSPNPMSSEHASLQKFRQLGLDAFFTSEGLQFFDKRVVDLYKQYFSLEPPTPYEDANHYALMAMTFDALQEEFRKRERSALQKLLLATLPLGDVNAFTRVDYDTNDRIIFFDHGLFQFLYDFALLIAWATPPLSPQQLSSDIALIELPSQYTIPPQASAFLAGFLHGYAVEGTPLANPSPLPLPVNNMFTAIILLTFMERFVMAHELAHVMLGHLDKEQEKEQEYEADTIGLALLSTITLETSGSWGVCFWACDLVLIALNFLYRTLGLLAFGPSSKVAWISQFYPDPLSRRTHLREQVTQIAPNVPPIGLIAANTLCDMTEAIIQRLWEHSYPWLVASYQNGARQSPMWNKWIKSNLRA